MSDCMGCRAIDCDCLDRKIKTLESKLSQSVEREREWKKAYEKEVLIHANTAISMQKIITEQKESDGTTRSK